MISLTVKELPVEISTIYKSKEENIAITINPDTNRNGIPYFKVLNASHPVYAKSSVRILFNEPDYIISEGEETVWKFNTALLTNILNRESKLYIGITNWEAAKFMWNWEYFDSMFDIKKYFNGDYDEEYKDEPSYVPSILKIPDYTKLNFD